MRHEGRSGELLSHSTSPSGLQEHLDDAALKYRTALVLARTGSTEQDARRFDHRGVGQSSEEQVAAVAASGGVPTKIPTTVFLRRVREDLDRAEHDRAISPTAANAVLNVLSIALGNS